MHHVVVRWNLLAGIINARIGAQRIFSTGSALCLHLYLCIQLRKSSALFVGVRVDVEFATARVCCQTLKNLQNNTYKFWETMTDMSSINMCMWMFSHMFVCYTYVDIICMTIHTPMCRNSEKFQLQWQNRLCLFL